MNNGEVLYDLGPELYNKWVTGGAQGENVTVVDGDMVEYTGDRTVDQLLGYVNGTTLRPLIKVTGQPASIKNIALNANEKYNTAFRFQFNSPEQLYSGRKFTFYASQQLQLQDSTPQTTGSVKYIIKKTQCPDAVVSASAIGNTALLSVNIPSGVAVSSYQWYFNGTPITNAILPQYIAIASGRYFVQVTYDSTCVVSSNVLYLNLGSTFRTAQATTIQPDEKAELSFQLISKSFIYPNPSNSIVNIYLNSEKPIQIFVYNLLGEQLELPLSFIKSNLYAVDFSGTPNGLYQLLLKHENGINESFKIVISK